MRRHRAGDRAASRLPCGLTIEAGEHRLAHVELVERLDRRIEREEAVPAHRQLRGLVLVLLHHVLEDRRRRHAVQHLVRPARTWRAATLESDALVRMSTWFRRAGRRSVARSQFGLRTSSI